MASSSPDIHSRALPTAWTAQENLDNIAEAIDALEAYKKKDASKGKHSPPSRSGDI
jgi:ubiquitin-like protein ATG12